MTDGDNNADQLLKNADLALYRAKQDGRGVFRFFEPAPRRRRPSKRRQVELDLREAIRCGEFVLNFQPLVDGRTGHHGFEALMRWHHPVRGWSTGRFIPVAEETGLIVEIGEWVMTRPRQAASWPGDIHVAVNVSPVQFRPRRGAEGRLRARRVRPRARRLEIEITETALIRDDAEALRSCTSCARSACASRSTISAPAIRR